MTRDTSSAARDRKLAKAFLELADTLIDDFDVIDFLTGTATWCVDLLDVAAAGVMLADQRGSLRATAASDESAMLLELFEIQGEEGPCLDCYQAATALPHVDLSAGSAGGRSSRRSPARPGTSRAPRCRCACATS